MDESTDLAWSSGTNGANIFSRSWATFWAFWKSTSTAWKSFASFASLSFLLPCTKKSIPHQKNKKGSTRHTSGWHYVLELPHIEFQNCHFRDSFLHKSRKGKLKVHVVRKSSEWQWCWTYLGRFVVVMITCRLQLWACFFRELSNVQPRFMPEKA